ncbi:hypothetical protein [Neopusillimonas maritima]|jgi:N-methylhydantoinase A/oxoprolinase/acetone carboxylase beta subunit|uniref:Uncharacterized protein n=1 Tax=Neopusillimonas maritima TaxID=2026239 RepID=A0ABX9MVZ0_9BURK|nr:hypothetical protein [Neopusillimonas maritima]RII81662.1 hypothetical protein CJO09_15260 [Neopusillimonas maritima]
MVMQGYGGLLPANEAADRYHHTAPKIEVVSIGAGGGSIVSIDEATGEPHVVMAWVVPNPR